jgi:ACS family tartrate transporter-like MFS transporter
MSETTPPTAQIYELAISTRRRITWRILPFLIILYMIAFIDRVNVGYAKLQMNEDLKFSDAVYGFGAGIFFIGYLLLEIPGTLIVERWSARLWISRIMISWGIVAVLMGFVQTATQFYWLRFLLGLAEAGFYPGVIVYLSHWFRAEDRAKAVAIFMIGGPVSNVLGAPISGLIMEYIHWSNLAGWRWVFIIEGLPAILFGLATLFYLTDRPRDAKWLSPEQRAWITDELEAERARNHTRHSHNYWLALKEPTVLLLTGTYFLAMTGMYGFSMWLPTLLKKFSGFSILQVTLLSAIPYAAALGAMLVIGWSSDRRKERIWHASLPLLAASFGFVGSILWQNHLPIALAMLSLVGCGLYGFFPAFWSLPSAFLAGSAAAVSVGLINSVGNVGGFVGPYVVGYISDKTGSFNGGMLFLSMALAGASLCLMLLRAFSTKFSRAEPRDLPLLSVNKE